MKPMTDEEYVKNQGVRCPFCGSEDVQGGSFDVNAGEVYQEMECLDCKKTWEDHYVLVGYVATEPDFEDVLNDSNWAREFMDDADLKEAQDA